MINFDSRETLYKSHFGAIEEGKHMRLRLRLDKDCGVWFVFLLIRKDSEAEFRSYEMKFEFASDGCLYYETDISLDSGLYWYKFKYTTEYDEHYVTRAENSQGYTDCEGDCWQQTVYKQSDIGPDWLLGGVIYQIFPDRFYYSGREKKNIPNQRYLRSDWGGCPEYRQEGNKLSLGNDFFMGDLKGIEEKLPYLEKLGVTAIYLNPIFEASSNHRYNTGDYEKIDPLLGTEEDFKSLCKNAEKKGIHIILDGVFSHTGEDSKYFDKYHKYTDGACDREDSPYREWYKFERWPDKYHSWWGIDTLPEVIESSESYLEYICSEKGILRRWLSLGADGWRLDVADELPDVFLDRLREAVKSEKPDAYILGEVWEDATNKISYSSRRRYLLGDQLDSVMNYPFATAIVSYLKGGNAEEFTQTVLSVCENYPKPALNLLMNHVGTHDTARILTALGVDDFPPTRALQAERELSAEELKRAKNLLYLAAALQFTLPGVPSVYYGDEAGLTGFGDPFCRGCYPWGNEDNEILGFYKALSQVRKENTVFRCGQFVPVISDGETLAYIRRSESEKLLIAFNPSETESGITLPLGFGNAHILLSKSPENSPYVSEGRLNLPPLSFAICAAFKNNNQ